MEITNLVNAQDMAKKYPDTFEAPTKEELDSIKVGDSVKICNGQERFWVKLDKVSDRRYIYGTVDNNLIEEYGYNLGDRIRFMRKHIYTINSKEEKDELLNLWHQFKERYNLSEQQQEIMMPQFYMMMVFGVPLEDEFEGNIHYLDSHNSE